MLIFLKNLVVIMRKSVMVSSSNNSVRNFKSQAVRTCYWIAFILSLRAPISLVTSRSLQFTIFSALSSDSQTLSIDLMSLLLLVRVHPFCARIRTRILVAGADAHGETFGSRTPDRAGEITKEEQIVLLEI